MKISVICQYNPNMFPALHYLAVELGDLDNQVQFMSRYKPDSTGVGSENVVWMDLPRIAGVAARIPLLRSAYPGMYRSLARFKPDLIIAQHEYLIPALAYKMTRRSGAVKVAGYFCDYYKTGKGMALVTRFADRLDAYVDICDMRLGWRQQDWPQMDAETFLVRQAPHRPDAFSLVPHSGPVRIAYTGSRNTLRLNKERLSRFFNRLSGHGVAVDWYLAGGAAVQASDELREEARGLSDNPLYRVCDPVDKAQLMPTLEGYDAGLFWALLADMDETNVFEKAYLLSAASNKIGEYIAAGLVVAHTGNPGLSYLPEDVSAVFDPTDPEAGADQLAAALADRAVVERKREAALRYHLDEMNFEAQAAPFIRYVMGETAKAAA